MPEVRVPIEGFGELRKGHDDGEHGNHTSGRSYAHGKSLLADRSVVMAPDILSRSHAHDCGAKIHIASAS
jgi:hypothetical protein